MHHFVPICVGAWVRVYAGFMGPQGLFCGDVGYGTNGCEPDFRLVPRYHASKGMDHDRRTCALHGPVHLGSKEVVSGSGMVTGARRRVAWGKGSTHVELTPDGPVHCRLWGFLICQVVRLLPGTV